MLCDPSQPPKGPITPGSQSKLPALDPQALLDKKVEAILGGAYVSSTAFELAEQLIKDRSPALIVQANELEALLAPKGFSIDTRICKTRLEKFSCEPVIVLTIKDSNGGYGLPSANLLWDPIIEDSCSSPSEKEPTKKVLTIDHCAGWYSKGRMLESVLSVETFSLKAPVAIVIGASSSYETPVRAYPILSEPALSEAREHAARGIRANDFATYSHLLHEVIYPAVGAQVRARSELFGAREIPQISDRGSDPLGETFKLYAYVSEVSSELPIDGIIVEHGLGLRMKAVAGNLRRIV
jgi:hypothetical protein